MSRLQDAARRLSLCTQCDLNVQMSKYDVKEIIFTNLMTLMPHS